ncbi:hypothetical protein JZO78_11425 [Enterococcus ureilyticus]|nr:hypothetical protein [Enterococcus ureilyticus]
MTKKRELCRDETFKIFQANTRQITDRKIIEILDIQKKIIIG